MKPRLRGVFHQYAFFVALVAGVDARRTRRLRPGAASRRRSTPPSSPRCSASARSTIAATGVRPRARVDAAARPLEDPAADCGHVHAVRAARAGRQARDVLLVLIWAGAAAGLVLNLVWIDAPGWLAAVVYLALGWTGVARDAGAASAVGGTAGDAALRRRRRSTRSARSRTRCAGPNPWPAVFGFHEIFHLLVIARRDRAVRRVAGVRGARFLTRLNRPALPLHEHEWRRRMPSGVRRSRGAVRNPPAQGH